jgi:peptidoglycan hydrolase-like protein with peptidoglycan-binding domain
MPTQKKKPVKKKITMPVAKLEPLSLSRPINRRMALIIAGIVAFVGLVAVGLSGASSKTNPYFADCSKLNSAGLPTLKAGDKGPCVQAAQYTMQYFGVKVTGTYDTQTVQTVNFLQSLQKVPQSGQINPVMWAYLFGNPFATKCQYPFPEITPTKNNTGNCVDYLQWQIIDNGYTKNMVINGKYDNATQDAVALTHYVLKDTATPATTVDAATWVALLDYKKQYVAPVVAPTPVAVPAPGNKTLTPVQIAYINAVVAQHPTVSFGAVNNSVKDVQNRLCISSDGIFGNQTLAAVKSFQGRNGLPVSGVVDSNTWSKLLTIGTQCQGTPGTISGGSGGSGGGGVSGGVLSPAAGSNGNGFQYSNCGYSANCNGNGYQYTNIGYSGTPGAAAGNGYQYSNAGYSGNGNGNGYQYTNVGYNGTYGYLKSQVQTAATYTVNGISNAWGAAVNKLRNFLYGG